ncbi:hypothetical protein DFR75_1174 [Nocardia ignorata]|uniref:Uncharacterized protein n=1 Tax=Nocardia ignorata TaxID=145285 RepID=A0A4R6NZ81_NOCIG|nr:hypothetical protein DFR75_1174 [Nocardia ignorata]
MTWQIAETSPTQNGSGSAKADSGMAANLTQPETVRTAPYSNSKPTPASASLQRNTALPISFTILAAGQADAR